MKKNGDLLFIGLFAVTIIMKIIWGMNVAIYLAVTLACFGFLSSIKLPILNAEKDERDQLIAYKASSIAFGCILLVISYGSLVGTTNNWVNQISVQEVMQGLLIYLYMTYCIAHAVLKRVY